MISLDTFKESFLKPVVTETTTNIVLSGLQTINTINLEENNYVKVSNQLNEEENGFYKVTLTSWIKEDPKPLLFFNTEGRLEDFYLAISNELFELAGCILQESFNNLNIYAFNFNLNPNINNLNIYNLDHNLIYLQEQDFLIDLNELLPNKNLGVFHIKDLLDKNYNNNLFSFNRINYFMLELTNEYLIKGSVFHTELNNFLNRNTYKSINISLEYKKYLIATYLNKQESNLSINYYTIANSSLQTLKYFYNLFDLVYDNNIISGILFENIVNEESYKYFIQKMYSFNCCNTIIDKLNLI